MADLRLATAVRLALIGDARTRPLDVVVAARDGVVSVSGSVPTALAPTAAEIARRVRGVRRLDGFGAGDAPPPTATPISSRPLPRPASPRSPEPTDAAYHTVERGDTMFSLARRYGTTVETILRLNGLDRPDIRIGQRLRVR